MAYNGSHAGKPGGGMLRDTDALLSREEAGMHLERVISSKWKDLSAEEREALIGKAQAEQQRLIAEGGAKEHPPETKAKGKTKTKAPKKTKPPALGPDGLPLPKRPRGRPPKNPEAKAAAAAAAANARAVYICPPELARTMGADGNAVLPVAQTVTVSASDGFSSSVPPGGEDLVGRRVEGVVDGCFDVGYFLTVRVNGCLLRGIVWGEDTSTNAVGQRAPELGGSASGQGSVAKQGAGGEGGKGGTGGGGTPGVNRETVAGMQLPEPQDLPAVMPAGDA